MAFKMKGSPAKMGTIKGTTAHRSALRQVEEEKNLLEKHEEWKTKRAEKRKTKIESGEIMGNVEKQQRKYGTGEYTRSGEKADLAMKPGESKYQYNVRMKKEAPKREKKATAAENYTVNKRDLTFKAGNWVPKKGAVSKESDRAIWDGKQWTDNPETGPYWGDITTSQSLVVPEAPASPTTEVIPNTYGTFSGDDWNKVDEVSGLNLHQLVNKRDELALAGNKDSYAYSKAQEAINIANANKTKTWKGEVETEEVIEEGKEDPNAKHWSTQFHGYFTDAELEKLQNSPAAVEAAKAAENLRLKTESKTSTTELETTTETIEARIESLKREKERTTSVMKKGKIIAEIKQLQTKLRGAQE